MNAKKISTVPHSWPIEDWPPHVFPGRGSRARHLLHRHRDALIAAGGLVRIGKTWCVLGAGYVAWLAAQASKEGIAA